jgi:hypothetical protein
VTRAFFIAACCVLALAGPGCDRAQEAPAPRKGGAPRAETPPPQDGGRRPETLPAAEPVTGSRPASRPWSKDVPEDSRDPVVDGMKSLIREMMLKGLVREAQPELEGRIVAILARADLGDEGGRQVEARNLARTLLEVQDDFKTKGGAAKTALTEQDEQRVRVAAETLARDLYKKLSAATAARAGSAHTGGILRAAPVVKVPAGYEAVTWKAIGGFEYTEGMKLPDDVRALDGKKVGIAGYMMTIEEVENIHEFLLVEAFWSCCFGVPPNVNQVVMVKIEADKGVEYTSSPVLVLGTLSVGEEIEDGFVTSVYRIKATSVTATE